MAVIVTGVDAVTALVVTVNVALVLPAATVTLDGTAATAGLPLESDTTVPPAGAAAVSVTVPVDGLPPTTVPGLRVRVAAWSGGVTVRVAEALEPL